MLVTSTDFFSFHVAREHGAVVVTVHGDLDLAGASRLGTVLGDLVDDQGNMNVVVDLRDVGEVDMAAAGVFPAAATVARHHGGRLRLRGVPRGVSRAFGAAGPRALAVSGAGHPQQAGGDGPAPGPPASTGTPVATLVAAPAGAGVEPAPHAVSFYERDDSLVELVRAHVEPALLGDAGAVVVATAPHREALAAALAGAGVEEARAAGRYVEADAAEALSTFMAGGAPDPLRFRRAIGTVVARAGAGGRPVRVYGEMVAVLWGEGNVAAAIELEDLWNDLARSHDFSLLCAYPLNVFERVETVGSFRRVCAQHSPPPAGGPARPS